MLALDLLFSDDGISVAAQHQTLEEFVMQVQSHMTKHVIFMGPEESLKDAWDTMKLGKIRHIPIVDDGRLVGILSELDCLKAINCHPHFKPNIFEQLA